MLPILLAWGALSLSADVIAVTTSDTEQPQHSSTFVQTPAFWGVIVAATACVVGLAGVVVVRGLSNEEAKEADGLGKTAQLAYINEQTEAEIAAEMYAEGKLGQEELTEPVVEEGEPVEMQPHSSAMPAADEAVPPPESDHVILPLSGPLVSQISRLGSNIAAMINRSSGGAAPAELKEN